jgi:guanosine-3',5'-bis(diphosphate) 3'-pyrophosphohydrolase
MSPETQIRKSVLSQAKAFAEEAHVSQLYGDLPYMEHINSVVKILEPYGEFLQTLGYLHDTVEDTSITQKDILNKFGRFISECVYLLTDPEEFNSRQEKKIASNTRFKNISLGDDYIAVLIVKAADRLANMRWTFATKSKYRNMYKKEYYEFKSAVYRPGLCDEIWKELDTIMENG